ncbi:MAG: ribosomal L7Ae/L30e/S12e/Gadd45 family protein [Clostridia bacterium]|nr:ribosomal L7Ae/L30e/S12e/Gadd45 family protein [Clostridia bacterium]
MHIPSDGKLKIGTKQALKALNNNAAKALYIARDAEEHVTRQLVEIAADKDVEIIYVETMKQLGKACKIDVGAATAVIVK